MEDCEREWRGRLFLWQYVDEVEEADDDEVDDDETAE